MSCGKKIAMITEATLLNSSVCEYNYNNTNNNNVAQKKKYYYLTDFIYIKQEMCFFCATLMKVNTFRYQSYFQLSDQISVSIIPMRRSKSYHITDKKLLIVAALLCQFL